MTTSQAQGRGKCSVAQILFFFYLESQVDHEFSVKERNPFSTATVIKIQCTLRLAILLVQNNSYSYCYKCLQNMYSLFMQLFLLVLNIMDTLLNKMAKSSTANCAINLKTLNKIRYVCIDLKCRILVAFLVCVMTFCHAGWQVTHHDMQKKLILMT